jgi:hypothetical protein
MTYEIIYASNIFLKVAFLFKYSNICSFSEKCEQEKLIDAPDIHQFQNSSIYENKKELIVY